MKKVQDMDSLWKIKYPNRNIYIMRDHNWAFSAWEIGRLNKEINPGAKLLHVDFHDDYLEPQRKIPEINNEHRAVEVGSELSICEFIKSARKTGTIGKVYMVGDYEVRNKSEQEYIHSYTFNQFEVEQRMNFFSGDEEQSFILDLDLDFFNLHAHNFVAAYNSNSYLYSGEYIRRHLERLKQYEEEWNIITVCVSPEHCGGYRGAQKLLDIFLNIFDLESEAYIHW